ncbi:hypothetical protein AQF98_00405 [Pedobacter sp. Hv1]|nr:hypothetical protein AQF98_00405 [Pedobacter sp. Hv1]
MANYDHIELTHDEIDAALHYAKGQKDAKLKMEAYKRKLFEQPKYEVLDYEALRSMIITNNPGFIIDNNNKEIFELLCQYFSNDPGFELDGRYSLKKGILLFGPVGCGKTFLMRLFGVNSFRPYSLISCRSIADQYSKIGSDSLIASSEKQLVYKHQYYGHESIGRCYDDLGTEELKKNYGNEVNVMQDIIYKVYDNMLIGHFHITTNLNSEEIENNYGTRIRSRMREMFNLLDFDVNAPDRRV